MNKIPLTQIREKFVDYFVKNNHEHIMSSSLIPHNDPSLMFVNSGMVQFKNIFTGQEKVPYQKAVTSQKCVRAGGKHNDLENVGYTARHHTFFEMLGNFSFGDYFKEEAIYHAWHLLTKEFALNKDKLYVTIYHTDLEAENYWKKIAGISSERIIKINTNDNFWSMGDTGPCGPCSEIFYDHGAHIPGGLPGTPEQDGDRYIEIWNMVFMEFEQIDANTRIALPKKSIDTGMGLERMSSVIQGVHDNYQIDLFKEIIAAELNLFGIAAEGKAIFSYRVIADHLRSISFLIADGVMPSNEGRGYVLRRIMRRAMNHAHQLGARKPIIYKLIAKLIELMGGAYTELKRGEDFISDIVKQEEIRFQSTLERGLKLLDEEIELSPTCKVLPGEVAFKLYDTYGFPLDLTQDILKLKEISVDIEGFDAKMLEQKDNARKSWSGSGENKDDKIWFELKARFGSSEFLGHNNNEIKGKILALLKNNILTEEISQIGQEFTLIANQTVFYGESGGQLGDIGYIIAGNCKIKVINTKKYAGGIIGHLCVLEEGSIKIGDILELKIDTKHRNNLKIHHSATHILHATLRNILGKNVVQKGSLVANHYLRFDFSHPKALTSSEIKIIEDKVNEIIRANLKLSTTLMDTNEAIKLGAMALFGEKYDNEVRVVSIDKEYDNTDNYSIELCGGTHVARTGDIGAFKIISESGIAAGIRRIEAICGEFVLVRMQEKERLLNEISLNLKTPENELSIKINSLLAINKQLEKELLELRILQLTSLAAEIDKLTINSKGYKLLVKEVENVDIKVMRNAAEILVKNHHQLIVVYINKLKDKFSLVVAVNKEIINKFNAAAIAKAMSESLDGTGGGSVSLAQGGGQIMGLTDLRKNIEKFIIAN